MEITLNNFGTHRSSSYYFDKGKIILLKGNSGEGKSTICRSLEWCLYGTNRKIETFGVSAPTQVRVKYKDIIIERKKKPSFLRVHFDGKDYENTIAQEIINRLFGSHDLWKLSSYIPQGQRCQLLENKNIDNMDRLNELTFRGENPDEFYEKIDTKIREKNITYRDLQSHNAFRKKALDTKMSQVQPTLKELQDNIDLDELIREEQVSQEEYRSLQAKRLDNERLRGQWGILNDRRKRLEDELGKDPQVQERELENYREKLPKMKDDIDKIRRRHELEKEIKRDRDEIKSLEAHLSGKDGISSPYFSQEGYYQLLNLEKQYQDNRDLAQRWNLIYREDVIKEEIEKTHKDIEESLFISEKNREWERNEDLKSQVLEESKKIKKIKGDLEKGEKSLAETQQVLKELFYDPEDMKNMKKEIDKLKELLKILDTREREDEELRSLKSREKELDKNYQEMTDEGNGIEQSRQEINDLQERERVLLLSQEALQCPLCHGKVNLNNRTLVPLGECPPGDIEEIKKSLVKKKRELKRLEDRQKDFLQITEELKYLRKKIVEVTKKSQGKKDPLPDRQVVQEGLDQRKKDYAEGERRRIESGKMEEKRIYLEKNLQDLIRQHREKEQFIKSLQVQIKDDLPQPKKIGKKVTDLKKRLSDLEKMIYVTLPEITSQEIKNLLKIEEIRIKVHKKELEKEKIVITEDNPDLPQMYEESCREYERKKKIAERQKALNEELEELTKKLGKIVLDEEINEKCQKTEKDIKNLQDIIKRRRDIEDLNKLIREYRVNGDEEKNLEKDLLKLNQLRTLINEVECQYLQKTVDLINETLEEVIESLFMEPISVTLDLYKELKSTHRLKQAVNIKCIYKGIEYGKIDEMSGGEGDRISLALIIALHKLSPSPVLLLDECISSLDGNLREQCLKSLREHLGEDKTAITIIHETVEGYFDEVIKV